MSDEYIAGLKSQLERLDDESSRIAGAAFHTSLNGQKKALITKLRAAGFEPYPVSDMSREDLEGEYLQMTSEENAVDDAEDFLVVQSRKAAILEQLERLGVDITKPIGWRDL